MVQERPLRLGRIAGVELEVRAAELDARTPSRGSASLKPSERYSRAVCLGVARVQRDVVEVVVDLGLRLDEAERSPSPTSKSPPAGPLDVERRELASAASRS